MDNIPVRVTSRQHDQPETDTPEVKQKRRGRRPRRLVKLIVLLVLIAAIASGVWYFFGRGGVAGQIDGSKYQAIFLTNGQVYFGKLAVVNGDYYDLTDVFYLQTDSTSTDSKNPQTTATDTSDDVKLIKLGSEVHGPEDKMVVSREQVLFFENLKSDGRVSASISDYLKKQ